MPESSLPSGCRLRPAKPSDKSAVQRLLDQLELELVSADSGSDWLARGLFLVVVGVVITGVTMVPGVRVILQALLVPTIVTLVVCCLVLPLTLQREWTHYWVIESDGFLIACAKLQQYSTYSVLYDLYVLPDWRKQGVGSHLVKHLGQQATKPLYLACVPARLSFYRRLGFAPVASKSLPPVLQYDLGLLTRPGIIPLVLM